MRLILTILLIGLWRADAQMVINASSPYRPTAVAFTGLLDDYSGAAAAYSLRKLDKDYTGSAIRVRRSSDNTEQDIGFTAGGDLDTASMKTFVGNNNGFVVTWYDQSGNARNATQATQANQPRIINSGTIDRDNGKVQIRFDGSNDVMNLSSAISVGANDLSIFTVNNLRNTITTTSAQTLFMHNRTDIAGRVDFLFFGDVTGTLTNERISWITNAAAGAQIRGAGQTTTNIVSGNYIYSCIYTTAPAGATSTTTMFQNGSLITLTNSSTGAFEDAGRPDGVTRIGAADANGNSGIVGGFFEFIVYNSDKSNDRSGIETNINTYYSIY